MKTKALTAAQIDTLAQRLAETPIEPATSAKKAGDNFARLADGTRKRTKLFSGFLSHYLIHDRYGRPPSRACKHALPGNGQGQ